MTFFDDVVFPAELLAYGYTSTPTYLTEIATSAGGEAANRLWAQARGRYQIVMRPLDQIAHWAALEALFRSVGGRAAGFRFRDPLDCTADHACGVLSQGLGTGLPTHQLGRQYARGATAREVRRIRKPVTAQIKRSGVAATAGTGAGQYALDATTGVVTWVPDAAASVTAVTVGAPTQITLASAIGLSVGQRLYLTGLAGADAGVLNATAHQITAVAGTTYTIATATAGKTITPAGQGRKYPQADESMTWAGLYDIPVRFDVDELAAEVTSRSAGGYLISVSGVHLIEIPV